MLNRISGTLTGDNRYNNILQSFITKLEKRSVCTCNYWKTELIIGYLIKNNNKNFECVKNDPSNGIY